MLISRLILFYLVTLMATSTFAMLHASKYLSHSRTPAHQTTLPLSDIIALLIHFRNEPSDFKYHLNQNIETIKNHEIIITPQKAKEKKLNLYSEMSILENLALGYNNDAQNRLEVIEYLQKLRDI